MLRLGSLNLMVVFMVLVLLAVSCSGGQLLLTTPSKEKLPPLSSSTPSDEVEDIPDGVIEITPPWLTFKPRDICINGHYAYVAGGSCGLHIFDLSDPTNPEWVDWLNIPDAVYDLKFDNGYLYATGTAKQDGHKFHIIKINPHNSLEVIQTIGLSIFPTDLAVSSGYAYITRYQNSSNPSKGGYVDIIDVSQPGSAYLINTVDTPGGAVAVDADKNYVYITDYLNALHIIDVSSPGTAFILNTIGIGGIPNDVAISDHLALITEKFNNNLIIVDINAPEKAVIIKEIDTADRPYDIYVDKGYAYITTEHSSDGVGLMIFDIDPPAATDLVNSLNIKVANPKVTVESGYAYLANGRYGLHVVDVEPPESAHSINIINTCADTKKIASGYGYAFVIDTYNNWQLMDISVPESTRIIKNMDLPLPSELAIEGHYIYAIFWDPGLTVFDFAQPDAPSVVKTVEIEGSPGDITLFGGWAYVTEGRSPLKQDRLLIIDIDPIDVAYIVSSVNFKGIGGHVAVDSEFAYVTANYVPEPYISDYYLHIIDINPPQSAHLVKTIEFSYLTYDVAVKNGYAFVANGMLGIQIIDIDPVESAFIINAIGFQGEVCEVVISGDFLFTRGSGFHIIDIEKPELPRVVSSFEYFHGYDINISGNYAYLACGDDGLRIFDFIGLGWRLADEH
jgi:hypothetical protein